MVSLSLVHHHVLGKVAYPPVRYAHLHLPDKFTVCCEFVAFFTC